MHSDRSHTEHEPDLEETIFDPLETDDDIIVDNEETVLEESPVYPEDTLRPEKIVNDAGRYVDFEWLGRGGVGVVKSCIDPHFNRRVAMKILHYRLRGDARQRTRFVREAQVLAQLEHPNIVPVHEFGVEQSGSLYFTMKNVQGESLRDILKRLSENDPETIAKYSLRYLVDEVFFRICQAVAFAHKNNVIHRDLKPQNILIGEFGEVLVMDWGLAKRISKDAGAATTSPTPRINQKLDLKSGEITIDGAVSGTPLYMAPEQALGLKEKQDERTDIYILGTVLYEILTLKRTVEADSLKDVLGQVVNSQITPPRKKTPRRNIPKELNAICVKALKKSRNKRYQNVNELIRDLRAFQRGLSVSALPTSRLNKAWKWCLRHAVFSSTIAAALLVLTLTEASLSLNKHFHYKNMMDNADYYFEQGDRQFRNERFTMIQLRSLDQESTSNIKTDRERKLEQQAKMFRMKREDFFEKAVILYITATDDPTDKRRAKALITIFKQRLESALMNKDYNAAAQWRDFTRHWLGKSLDSIDEATREEFIELSRQVRGDGKLLLSTEPVGAEAVLYEYVERPGGALVPANPIQLGKITDTTESLLPKGSYLLTLSVNGRPPVKMPISVTHSEKVEASVFIPQRGPYGATFIPAGSFIYGGPHSRVSRLRTVDLPAYYIKTTEVSFREYMEYWFAPDGANRSREDCSYIRLNTFEVEHIPAWDEKGVLLSILGPYMPVVGISKEAAERYCAWLTKRSGLLHRLPTAKEWEKAARGADGRDYPWGNYYNPAYAYTLENREVAEIYGYLAPCGSLPNDISPYGVLDMGGNAREWTSSLFYENSPLYQIKGSGRSVSREYLYCSYASEAPVVPSDVGFRYVIPLKNQSE